VLPEVSIKPPVFILGIMPRSGTNYLFNLLKIHPDCISTEVVWEDYALAHADQLARYSNAVTAHWDPAWGIREETANAFDAALGRGISEFLSSGDVHQQTLVKTPSVQNLDLFFRFFPDSPLLILVRDGRSVIESGVRSFGWRRESALHWLAREARTIVEFIDRYPPETHRYRLVRYEDLWQQPVEEMNQVLWFLGLDTERYDFGQARELPVRGSSEMLKNEEGDLHWDPLEKTESFDPLSRYGDWTDFMTYRFEQIAGSAMTSLGYKTACHRPAHFSWKLQSLLLDSLWFLKMPFRPLYRKWILRKARQPFGRDRAQ
jgi:hypothetical protein